MKRLEEYNARALAANARQAFWDAVAEQCPEVTTGDMAPGEDLAFERESISVVETWLRNNVPDEPKRWTLVIEAPEPTRVDEGTVTFFTFDDQRVQARVVEVHHEDMLERS